MGSIFGKTTKEIWLVTNVIQRKSLNLSRSQLPVNQIKSLSSPYLKHDLFYLDIDVPGESLLEQIVSMLKNVKLVSHQTEWFLTFLFDYFKISLRDISWNVTALGEKLRSSQRHPKPAGVTLSQDPSTEELLRVWSWVSNSSTIASAINNALASKGQIKKVMKTKDPKI